MAAVHYQLWLQFHTLVSASLAVILFLLYVRLFRQPFLKYWALGWFAMAVHEGAKLVATIDGLPHALATAAGAVGVVAAFLESSLLALAGLAVRPKPASRAVRGAVFAFPFALALFSFARTGALQALTLEQVSKVSLWNSVAPREILSAAALLYFAWMFSVYYPGAKSTAGLVTGLFCMLHAAHHAAVALTAEGLPVYSSVFAPTAVALEALMILGVSLGLIASVIEEAKLGWEQAESIWTASTQGMLLVSPAGRVLRANDAFCRMIRKAPEEIAGMPVPEIFSFEKPDASTGPGRRAVRLWNGDALWLDVSNSEVRTRSGRAIFSIFRDVTRQVETEAALERSRERMMLAFESTDDSVFDWRVSTGDLFLAPKMLQALGCHPGEIGGQGAGYLGLCVPEDVPKVNAALVEALKTPGARFEVEHRLLSRHGEPRWVLARGSVVERAADGRALRVAGTLRDITERRRIEEEREQLRQELMQAQKLDAIGRLASGVAHDFNNLLTVILGYSESVLSDPGNPGKVAEYVHEIREAGERASHLTSRLLAFSRKQVSQPRPLDLNEVLRDSEKMLRRIIGEDIAVTYSYAPALPPVLADPREIDQVLLNLAVNARDAMPEGGRLELSTGTATLADPPHLRESLALAPGSYVTLSVTDTGHGMDASVRARIFEPFFTTKEAGKGTGLGLSTVYWIVKQNGGAIDVESEPQKGARFVIYLPAVQCHAAPPPSAEPSAPNAGSETVLLVEDQDEVRRMLVSMLAGLGYTVIAASGGAEAMEALRAHPGPVDVLVTDVVMSDCRGPELAELIARERPGIKTLFISGYAETDAMGRLSSAPYLQKPFTADQLAQCIRRLLAPPEAETSLSAAR